MKTLKYDCPCTKDCPNRVVGCRSNCEPFQEYEKRRLAAYEQREQKRAADEFLFEGTTRGRTRMLKKRQALLKYKRGGKTRFG